MHQNIHHNITKSHRKLNKMVDATKNSRSQNVVPPYNLIKRPTCINNYTTINDKYMHTTTHVYISQKTKCNFGVTTKLCNDRFNSQQNRNSTSSSFDPIHIFSFYLRSFLIGIISELTYRITFQN